MQCAERSRWRVPARPALPLAAVFQLVACSVGEEDCTTIGSPSGVYVDVGALPPGSTGQVCLLRGACVAVTDDPPLLLGMPPRPAAADVEVRLVGRPVERLAVPLQPVYANGQQCGLSGYQRTVHLESGPSHIR